MPGERAQVVGAGAVIDARPMTARIRLGSFWLITLTLTLWRIVFSWTPQRFTRTDLGTWMLPDMVTKYNYGSYHGFGEKLTEKSMFRQCWFRCYFLLTKSNCPTEISLFHLLFLYVFFLLFIVKTCIHQTHSSGQRAKPDTHNNICRDYLWCLASALHYYKENIGLVRDLNPGPLAPKARIIPLDQQATGHRKSTEKWNKIRTMPISLFQCLDSVAILKTNLLFCVPSTH